MIYFIISKEEIVSYVDYIQTVSSQDLQSITVTKLEKSGDFCVSVVINSSSAETIDQVFKRFENWSSTSTENTQDG